MTDPPTTARQRRQPPPFRVAAVVRSRSRSPRLVRVTLGGPELAGLDPGLPAASVRLLLPTGPDLVMPEWDGNEFRHHDGSRPTIRTVTPVLVDEEAHELDVEVVLHGAGPLARWATTAGPGDPVAVSGTGRGHDVDRTASGYLLAGDETALPAIGVLLDALPPDIDRQVIVETDTAASRIDLPGAPPTRWLVRQPGSQPGDGLVDAIADTAIDPRSHVWVAGEAAAVQRVRRLLLDERGLDRSHTTIRGYWKVERSGQAGSD